MPDLHGGSAVYVVTDSYTDSGNPKYIVHGVYSSEKLARLAAYHPHSSLMVLRFWLDGDPVDEAEVSAPDSGSKQAQA